MSVVKVERGLQATRGFYRNYIKKYYEDAHQAKARKEPVAWVASTFPVEILQAMDIVPVWPENYASVCAARQVSVRLCEAAEVEGFRETFAPMLDACSGRCLTRRICRREECQNQTFWLRPPALAILILSGLRS